MKVKSPNPPHDFIVWNVSTSKYPLKKENVCRSKIQYKAGQQIKKRYPLDPIVEDITIPGTRLSLDFYLPQREIAFEIQGKQHLEYVPFFHKDKSDLVSQKKRDETKKFFCEINDIILYTIFDLEELKEILK